MSLKWKQIIELTKTLAILQSHFEAIKRGHIMYNDARKTQIYKFITNIQGKLVLILFVWIKFVLQN